jgi:NADH:ubiquinone oxidoreductase subunit K
VNIPGEHMLVLAAILFGIGAAGFFLRRNVIVLMM